jgi:hypothetical protein
VTAPALYVVQASFFDRFFDGRASATAQLRRHFNADGAIVSNQEIDLLIPRHDVPTSPPL